MEQTEINFFYETAFELEKEKEYKSWIDRVIYSEEKSTGVINYIFVDDEYLHQMNVQYLDHDTLTDIISFDNSVDRVLHGDIYISIDRVKENASEFNSDFIDELNRVIIHGILHFIGYKDKSESDAGLMRQKEDEKLKMFHVEQS
ncbi:rRNA maturation RNase YbeY [Gramella sp. AN32]|uniref:Endoribonuclease YbeY n=1 Tax=Christiangramia antarctica TaxID=2058158 RepID=A0ABW5WYZ8_9FLAO|nr:rRNA maturation RNase YbeY [Gramella sp. AN32]MCM4155005.1 rRNA maturation RNase YbeY [Gramella sp. AN32]